jgi:hypothetical protein
MSNYSSSMDRILEIIWMHLILDMIFSFTKFTQDSKNISKSRLKIIDLCLFNDKKKLDYKKWYFFYQCEIWLHESEWKDNVTVIRALTILLR